MTQPLNRAIELHDSTLSGVSQVESSIVLQFSAAYVHESSGKPGVDAGSGWYQPATFTVTGARLQSSVAIPATLDDGFLRCDTALHRNGIPLGSPFQARLSSLLLHELAIA